MGFNGPFHCKLLESRAPLCSPLPQSAACLPISSKAARGMGLLEVPLGAQTGFWLHNLWWAATLPFFSNNLAILSTTTAEGGTKITQSLHQDRQYPSCKIHWLPHWELPLLSHNLYMCFYKKELTPRTNTHGKIHHGSWKQYHLLALLRLSEISDGFMKTWNKTKNLLRLT